MWLTTRRLVQMILDECRSDPQLGLFSFIQLFRKGLRRHVAALDPTLKVEKYLDLTGTRGEYRRAIRKGVVDIPLLASCIERWGMSWDRVVIPDSPLRWFGGWNSNCRVGVLTGVPWLTAGPGTRGRREPVLSAYDFTASSLLSHELADQGLNVQLMPEPIAHDLSPAEARDRLDRVLRRSTVHSAMTIGPPGINPATTQMARLIFGGRGGLGRILRLRRPADIGLVDRDPFLRDRARRGDPDQAIVLQTPEGLVTVTRTPESPASRPNRRGIIGPLIDAAVLAVHAGETGKPHILAFGLGGCGTQAATLALLRRDEITELLNGGGPRPLKRGFAVLLLEVACWGLADDNADDYVFDLQYGRGWRIRWPEFSHLAEEHKHFAKRPPSGWPARPEPARASRARTG